MQGLYFIHSLERAQRLFANQGIGGRVPRILVIHRVGKGVGGEVLRLRQMMGRE